MNCMFVGCFNYLYMELFVRNRLSDVSNISICCLNIVFIDGLFKKLSYLYLVLEFQCLFVGCLRNCITVLNSMLFSNILNIC